MKEEERNSEAIIADIEAKYGTLHEDWTAFVHKGKICAFTEPASDDYQIYKQTIEAIVYETMSKGKASKTGAGQQRILLLNSFIDDVPGTMTRQEFVNLIDKKPKTIEHAMARVESLMNAGFGDLEKKGQ